MDRKGNLTLLGKKRHRERNEPRAEIRIDRSSRALKRSANALTAVAAAMAAVAAADRTRCESHSRTRARTRCVGARTNRRRRRRRCRCRRRTVARYASTPSAPSALHRGLLIRASRVAPINLNDERLRRRRVIDASRSRSIARARARAREYRWIRWRSLACFEE